MIRRKHAAWLWYAILWCPCFAISQVLFRYRFSGTSRVPVTGPVLIVSNHQSNLDPVIVGLACPRQLKYLARQGLFFFPFNLWIRALGAVAIDRERGALAGIRATLELLKQGNAVLVFPEGSRTEDGQLHEMLPGFCLLARRSGATIVPAALDGAFQALPRGSFIVRPHPIGVSIGAPITPRQYEQLSDQQLTELVTSRIAQALVEARRELSPGPSVPGFLRRKRNNSLLAGPVDAAVGGENNN
jgi:1-acyl-sn-glycerol-3-phosphate acyltransferase